MVMQNTLRPATVKLVSRLLIPLMDSGTVTNREYKIIAANLSHLAKHGEPMPAILPKLITSQEAAEMLGVSHSQFRALEHEGLFPFRRRSVGGRTVRYKNTDVIAYMDYCETVQTSESTLTVPIGTERS